MLDEPALMVRMLELACFMDDSFVILQSKRSQLCARRLVISVKNALNFQTFRDLDEQRSVFDINYLPRWRQHDVQCQPEDFRVGLAKADEAGRNKSIYK